MMKNIISSPYRKMKVFIILPVFAIILYAFAIPEYKYTLSNSNPETTYPVIQSLTKEVKGTIFQQDGKPLQGASVVIKGTTMGVSADSKGYFKLDKVPEEAMLVVSYIGLKTRVIKPVFTSDMTIKMMNDTVNLQRVSPPPPPPPPFKIRSENGIIPLVIVDGNQMTEAEYSKIDPDSIEAISVLKDKSATAVFGEIGKNGVIVVTTKKVSLPAIKENDVKDANRIVEEMPTFSGGEKEMQSWINNNIKVIKGAEKISVPIYVVFTVDSKGKVRDVKVLKKKYPVWEKEAIRIVSSMPDWKPGSQNGKPIDVILQLPIDFKLK